MELTQKLLNEYFEYKDGELYWKKPTAKKIRIGSIVGSVDARGYKKVRFFNKVYAVHRIIFLMHHGYLPTEIDHKDNNKINNKIENLRPATVNQNRQNALTRKDNSSGAKGVSFDKNKNKWNVRIQVNKKTKRIGYFEDLELADLVAQEARDLYHGEFAKA